VSIAQNLFLAKLEAILPSYTTAVSPEAVVNVGATGLQELAGPSTVILVALRKAYAHAIRDALIYALTAACAALPFACSMQWFNIKTVAKERRQAKRQIITLEERGVSKSVEEGVPKSAAASEKGGTFGKCN
jgi:hypothetical protein